MRAGWSMTRRSEAGHWGNSKRLDIDVIFLAVVVWDY